ncbi:hypothetical protein [Maribacter sp. LLG6340-A2]|uniref:hypothetical protein n=1 Tax=Maribacter sp. LLG6340-A2 TaxID=3160834 RepID=UPI00386B9F9C
MEIEELQSAWVQMSSQLEQQKKLTDEIILNMTKEKYQNKFKTVTIYETIGALICFGIALVILVKFGELNTWYLKLCGILTLAYMIILPVMVLKALKDLKSIDILNGLYKDNLARYIKRKNRLLRMQQWGMVIGIVGMLFILPTFSKISSDKDIFMEGLKTLQWIFLTVVLAATICFCLWGYKAYVKLTKSAQKLLTELE